MGDKGGKKDKNKGQKQMGKPDCVVISIDGQPSDKGSLAGSLLEILKLPYDENINLFFSYVPDPLNLEKREVRNVAYALVHGQKLGMEIDPSRTRFQNFRTSDPSSGVILTCCAMFFFRKR
jgi:hypothetical protein